VGELRYRGTARHVAVECGLSRAGTCKIAPGPPRPSTYMRSASLISFFTTVYVPPMVYISSLVLFVRSRFPGAGYDLNAAVDELERMLMVGLGPAVISANVNFLRSGLYAPFTMVWYPGSCRSW